MAAITLREASARLGIDYDGAVYRFCESKAMFLSFLRMLPDDPTFSQIQDAVCRRDWPQAERAAHTLKGIAANLGLSALRDACQAMVSAVSTGSCGQLAKQAQTIAALYQTAVETILQISQSE